MARARENDPEGYLHKAWRLYGDSPEDEILTAALLSELSAGLSEEALDLRASVGQSIGWQCVLSHDQRHAPSDALHVASRSRKGGCDMRRLNLQAVPRKRSD